MITVPRDEANRMRLYVLEDGVLRLVATGPDGPSIGAALVTLAEEGEWDERATIGVLDTHATEAVPGTWVLSPFA